MTDPKNLNKCCPTNDGNVGKAIHSLSNRIKYLERINSDIESSIDEEKSRAIDVENTLQQHIEEEQNRAATKEEEILLALNEEQTRAEDAELALSNKIDLDIETERNRAIDVETTISSNLTEEIAARKQAITNIINSIPDAQILPDWNLSDSNAKDFIKNKPQVLDGKSAYELAVDNGFEGTEQEWLASLKGIQGMQGEQGPQGIQGIQGETGETGPQGPQGVLGEQGPKGDSFTYEDFTSAQLEALRGPQGEQGPAGLDGSDGADGQDGAPGLDGHSPVVTASKSGSTTTIYVDGTSIATIEDGLDGQDGQNGTNGTNGTNGSDGVTPHIDSTTGNWFIGTTDTGVHAQGPAGLDGSNGTNGSNGQDGHTPVVTASKSNGVTTVSVDGTAIATINDGQDGSDGTNGTNGLNGVTPHIDSTSKHWMIGSTDTGIVAEGQNGTNGSDGAPGQDGITPHIDSTTKHWMIGETDTGVVAEGLNVADPVTQSELEEVEKVTAIALTQLDERVSGLENDSVATSSNYYDKSEIDQMFVNAASGGSVDLSGYAKTADLATVATSGDYNDLINKPTIPSAPDLTNYIQKSSTSGLLKNDGTVDTNTYLTSHQDISGKANSADLATVAITGSYNDLTDKSSLFSGSYNANNHTFVDLGLPSGTLWATMNIGASSETDAGLRFLWGDTLGYSTSQIGNEPGLKSFSPSDYKWTQDNGSTFSKYNSTDGKYICDLEDDAANANWGGDWCLPSREDFSELINNTNWEVVTLNEATVFKATSKINSSKYIIIPTVVGSYWGNYVADTNDIGHTYNRCGLTLEVDPNYARPYRSQSLIRWNGVLVRAVLHCPTSLHKVATSGSYNDLTDKPTIPTIPTKTSDLTNDSGYLTSHLSLTNYVQKSLTRGLLKNDGTVDTSTHVKTPSFNANSHDYADLGLPSGTLWATVNVGASVATDYGNYYMYGKGSTLYNSSDSGYTGIENPLNLSVDTGRQVWSGDWHMPTKEQCLELIDNTTITRTEISGVAGFKFKGPNNNYIFFPCAGDYESGTLVNSLYDFFIWTSSIKSSNNAPYFFGIDRNNVKYLDGGVKTYGFSVRPVIDNPYIISKVATSGSYNDLTDKPIIPQIWRGTLSQYNAITTPDNNTIYIITAN